MSALRWKIRKTSAPPGTPENPWVVTQVWDDEPSDLMRCSSWDAAWWVVERSMRVWGLMGLR